MKCSTLIPESSWALAFFMSAFQASFVMCSTPFELGHCHPNITKGGILVGCFQGSVMGNSLVQAATPISSNMDSDRALLLN